MSAPCLALLFFAVFGEPTRGRVSRAPQSEPQVSSQPGALRASEQVSVLDRVKPMLFEHHRQALLARQLDVLERWHAASPELRASVAEAALRFLPEARGSGRRARPQELVLLARLLEGGSLEEARQDQLFALARALDLRVQPGTVYADEEASVGEPGPPLTVQAALLFPSTYVGRVQLELHWVAPDGRRSLARSESFPATALRSPGVPMYVRAPAEMLRGSPATASPDAVGGSWTLQPEVVVDGRRAVGLAVPVPVVPSASASRSAGQSERETLRRTYGVRELRPLVGRRLGRSATPGGVPADPGEVPPTESWEQAFAGLDTFEIAAPGSKESRSKDAESGDASSRETGSNGSGEGSLFVLVAPHGEPAELLACGAPGRALAGWANDAGHGVLSVAVAREDHARFVRAMAHLRAAYPGSPLFVVGRGDAAVQLAMWATRDAWEMDGLLLCAERVPLATRWREIPVWVVAQEESRFAVPSVAGEADSAQRLLWKRSPWPSAWFHDADLVAELEWMLATAR